MADFPWCRLYNDILSDRKIERVRRMTKLPRVIIRGAFMSMMAMANDSPQRGHLMLSAGLWLTDAEICDDLEMERADFDVMLEAFIALRMVTRHDHGGLQLTHFDKRQFRSDLSTPRVQQHRASKAKKAKASSETPDPASYATPQHTVETLQQRYGNPSDTDTETEVTETESETDAAPVPVLAKTVPITPGPEPQKPAPALTQQEVDAYLATPDPVLLEHWPTLRLEMQGQVTRDMYDQWIAPLRPLVMRDHTAFFCHPTTFGQEWCTSRLKVMIDRTVRSIVPDSMGAAVLVGGIP